MFYFKQKIINNPNISLWQRIITDYTRTLKVLDAKLYMAYNLIYAKRMLVHVKNIVWKYKKILSVVWLVEL